MKVITICQADWCNVGYATAKALRTVGINAESYKTSKHNFGYAEESKVVSRQIMVERIRKADVIFLMNSSYFGLELCKQFNKRHLYVYHTGTNYRGKPQEHNDRFNPYVQAALTDQTEFIGLGMKNEQYIFSAIDTEKIYCEISKPQ